MRLNKIIAAVVMVMVVGGLFGGFSLVGAQTNDNNIFGPTQWVRVLPVVENQAGGWSSSVSIANQSSSPNLVRITYNDLQGNVVWSEERTIPGYGGWQSWVADGHLPIGYQGTAKIEAQYFASVVVHETHVDGSSMAYSY